jgi:hypothetical protein
MSRLFEAMAAAEHAAAELDVGSCDVGALPPIDVRNELWYPRFFHTNAEVLNNAKRKNVNVVIKMIGIQGDLKCAPPTRYEWTALQEDINIGIGKGTIRIKPRWVQTDIEYLDEEFEWADGNADRLLIICSCPSQIGQDRTIMQKVRLLHSLPLISRIQTPVCGYRRFSPS